MILRHDNIGDVVALVVTGIGSTAMYVTGAVSGLVAQAVDVPIPPMLDRVLDGGIMAALVWFFVWANWRQTDRMMEQLSKNESEQKALLIRTLESMDKSTDAVRELQRTMAEMQTMLRQCNTGGK